MSRLVTALALSLVALPGAAIASSSPPSSSTPPSTSSGGGATSGGPTSGSPSPTSVPEPAAYALFGLGVVGLVIGRRLHRKRTKKDDQA